MNMVSPIYSSLTSGFFPQNYLNYSWPPEKYIFRFNHIEFRNSHWSINYYYRGNLIHLPLDPQASKGKFVFFHPNHFPISFEKVDGGWLGRAVVKSYTPERKSLLLLFLSDQGKAQGGLWDIEEKKFFSINTNAFLQNPNALPLLKETFAASEKDLPHPFSCHGKAFSYLRALSEPLRRDWGKLQFHIISDGSAFFWKVNRKTSWESQEFSLPIEEQPNKKPQQGFYEPLGAASSKIFSKWIRKEKCWVSLQAIPLGPEALGLVSQSALRLALYDNGLSVLTLEEERKDGTRILYRLDPSWLSNPKEVPTLLSTRKLFPSETFEGISFEKEARSEQFGLPNFRFFDLFKDQLTLGGVAI
jgi:hypothetical protein